MKTLLEIQKETAKEFQCHAARFAPFSLRIAKAIKERIDELEEIYAETFKHSDPRDMPRFESTILGKIREEWKSFLGELDVEENILKISIEIKQNEEIG